MKQLLITCFFLLASHSFFAQIKFRNFSSKDPYTLTIGLENLLLFDDSIIYLKNGIQHFEPSNGLYRMKVSTVGLQAYDAYSQNGKVETILFDVKRTQDGNLKLGKLGSGGIVKKEEILSNTYLSFSAQDSTPLNLFEVISFRLMLIPKKGDMTEFSIKSNVISPNVIHRIHNLSSHDVLIFEEVMVRSQDGTIRKVPGMSFQLK